MIANERLMGAEARVVHDYEEAQAAGREGFRYTYAKIPMRDMVLVVRWSPEDGYAYFHAIDADSSILGAVENRTVALLALEASAP